MNYTLKKDSERYFFYRNEIIEGREVKVPFGYIQETAEDGTYLVYCGSNHPDLQDPFNSVLYNRIKDIIVDREHKNDETWDDKEYKHYFYNVKATKENVMSLVS